MALFHLIHWVDVQDELPPGGVDLLIACADGVQHGVRRGTSFRSALRGSEPVSDVTHWAFMPHHPLNEDPDPWAEPKHEHPRSKATPPG